MDFNQVRAKLMAKGYTTDTANAKIAHDVVLDAIKDVDFLHYSPSDTAIRRFVSKMNSITRARGLNP